MENKPDITAVYEAMIAMSVALSEQLDIDRLIVALHRLTQKALRDGDPISLQVAELLSGIGKNLTDIDRLRGGRKGAPH